MTTVHMTVNKEDLFEKLGIALDAQEVKFHWVEDKGMLVFYNEK